MGFTDPLTDYCLRGIKKADWLHKDGSVSAVAFYPDDRTLRTRQEKGLEPGYETSINWEDDDGAVSELRKSGAAANGVARLLHARVEDLEQQAQPPRAVFGERRDDGDGNAYHGNIVFAERLATRRIREWAAVLAVYSTLV